MFLQYSWFFVTFVIFVNLGRQNLGRQNFGTPNFGTPILAPQKKFWHPKFGAPNFGQRGPLGIYMYIYIWARSAPSPSPPSGMVPPSPLWVSGMGCGLGVPQMSDPLYLRMQISSAWHAAGHFYGLRAWKLPCCHCNSLQSLHKPHGPGHSRMLIKT